MGAWGRKMKATLMIHEPRDVFRFDIEPDEKVNMNIFDAFELTHAAPDSVCWNAVALPNIHCILTTRDTSHLDKSWLKNRASQNMAPMLVTRDTSHLDRSWLKEVAKANIFLMLVTRDTSHLDKSWSKEVATANIQPMSVTRDTSHLDKSWSKEVATANIWCMSVTRDTSHSPIGPRFPAEQLPTGENLRHFLIALLSSSRDGAENAAVDGWVGQHCRGWVGGSALCSGSVVLF